MAADAGHAYAEERLAELGREVEGVYREASRTAEETLRAYLARFEEEDAARRAAMEAGDITRAEYRSWRSSRIAAGRRYRLVLRQVADGLVRADETALAAVEGRLADVYAENFNYGTYQVEGAARADTSFALQDASTVQTLLSDHGGYLPKPKVDVPRDERWNRRMLANQISQGVLLGEGMPKIAARVRRVTGADRSQAMRVARTSVTAAECAGRVASYRRAQGMGIDLQQEWMATLDGRTRSSHRELDGERAPVGGTFSNGCRYPGDPEAPYAETMNCRCTLVAVVDGIDPAKGERFSRLPEGMGYEEWRASKPARVGSVPANRTIAEFMAMPGTARKLDAAGVSRTEARRLLTAQLRDYGIPSGSFRKMGAGDQQKALDAALATERGISGKREASLDARVDLEKIRSQAYATKLKELKALGKAGGSVARASVSMLTHRNGSECEDLVLVSKSTGEVVGRSTNPAIPLTTLHTDKIKAAIAKAPHGDLISVHNHPSNLPPTGSDFASCGYNGFGGGIVALHNGEVFYYESGGMPFMAGSFDKKVEQKVKMGMEKYDAILETMREYEGSHGIKWEKL